MHAIALLVSLATLSPVALAGYTLEDDYFSGNFFDKFAFWDTADPTHGFVKYQNRVAAQSAGLITTSGSNAQIKVDSTNVQPDGRSSVRLTSNKSYNNGLVVIDVAHMPSTCGTWPSFWMVGPNWPNSGEIDIMEGVNDGTMNAMTLHTGPGCSISNHNDFSGHLMNGACTSSGSNNQGCGIQDTRTNSYGPGFNSNNGGVWATEITDGAINIWFWPRGSVPGDALSASPDPAKWGKPAGKFYGDCNIPNTFKNLQLVFDTTFCGDWAGATFGSSSCASKASSCTAFVANNPAAFKDAFWSVNALKVYKASGKKARSDEEKVVDKLEDFDKITSPVSEGLKPSASLAAEV